MSFRFLAFLRASHDRLQCRRHRLQFESLENRRMLAADLMVWPPAVDSTSLQSSDSDGTSVLDSTAPNDSEATVAAATSVDYTTVTLVIYVDPTTPVPDTSAPTSPAAATTPSPIAVDSTDPTDSPATDADP